MLRGPDFSRLQTRPGGKATTAKDRETQGRRLAAARAGGREKAPAAIKQVLPRVTRIEWIEFGTEMSGDLHNRSFRKPKRCREKFDRTVENFRETLKLGASNAVVIR